MPRLKKTIREIVEIPETWEHNGETFELGGGRVRLTSLSDEDLARCRKNSIILRTTRDGDENQTGTSIDEMKIHQNLFVSRLCGQDGYWEGFQDENGAEMAYTTRNAEKFSWDRGLYLWVVDHIGPIFDRIAENTAEEEEKNLWNTLVSSRAKGKK